MQGNKVRKKWGSKEILFKGGLGLSEVFEIFEEFEHNLGPKWDHRTRVLKYFFLCIDKYKTTNLTELYFKSDHHRESYQSPVGMI